MQRRHCRLSLLHGFLGSPDDWEGVISHLPEFECQALAYPFKIPEDTVVVGYSMGGRIALKSAQPKILLSAHPGLKSPEEKERRWKEDQCLVAKLRSEPFEKVLREWYDQPLFSTLKALPQFEEIFARRCKQNPIELAEILTKESLAHQTFSPVENAVFLHGQFDCKYAHLYRDLGLNSLEIPGVGHAAHLENPKVCAHMISEAVLRLA